MEGDYAQICAKLTPVGLIAAALSKACWSETPCLSAVLDCCGDCQPAAASAAAWCAHRQLFLVCDAQATRRSSLALRFPTQEFNTSDQQGPTMASRLFGPAPLDLDKARGSAALRVRRARAEGARGPLEVDCFQGASGQWFCQAARPRDPREGPEDVFLLYPGSGKRARDAHDMVRGRGAALDQSRTSRAGVG